MLSYICDCSWLSTFIVLLLGYWLVTYLFELLELPDLERRAVFITGCDRGFGREAALRLARKGCPVFAGCLTEEGRKSIEEEGASSRGRLVGLLLDITSDESVQKAVDFVKSNLPPGTELWALLNNAGVFSTYGPAEWCSIEEFKTAMELNFYGAVRCTHAFLPLIKQSKGRIGATTSVSGRLGTPGGTPYSSAKFALTAYMEAISSEMPRFGIHFAIFEPGIFKTQLLDREAKSKRVESVWNKMSEELREEYGEEYKQAFLTKWYKTLDDVGSTKTNLVPDAYIHFVTARFPRFRYKCGLDARFLWIPLSLLPTEWTRFVWNPPFEKPLPIAKLKNN